MDALKKIPEAEVRLRLAFHLIERGLSASDVQVAIDGAQVKTTDTIHFGISEFLRGLEWLKPAIDDIWQGTYAHARHKPKVVIHSTPGRGDVVATLIDGRTLRVGMAGAERRGSGRRDHPTGPARRAAQALSAKGGINR